MRRKVTAEQFLGEKEPRGWLGALILLAALGLAGVLWIKSYLVAVGP